MANDLQLQFNEQFKEALKLVKRYIDNNNGVQDEKIQSIQEQLELLSNQQGEGTAQQPSTLIAKIEQIILFLQNDFKNIANEVFFESNGNSDNGNGAESGDTPLEI